MKVGELTDGVKSEIICRKYEIARVILARKLSEIERARSILKKMKADLKEFEEMNIEDVDLSNMRY